MSAIPPLDQWPPELLYLYHERVCIKLDSHIPEAVAQEQAQREVWETSQKQSL